MVPAGQVRPTDALAKQHIPANKKTTFPGIKPDTSRGMSRKKKDLQLIILKRYGLTWHQQYLFAPVIFERHTPLETHGRRQSQNGALLFVEMKG